MSLCRKYQILKLKGEVALSEFSDLSGEAKLPMDLQDNVLDALREWERKKGLIVYSSHRDRNAKRARRENTFANENTERKGLKMHDRFKDSQLHDGADANVNPNPRINEHSEEAARNENVYRFTPKPGQRMQPPKPY